jgi:hypothetical protein
MIDTQNRSIVVSTFSLNVYLFRAYISAAVFSPLGENNRADTRVTRHPSTHPREMDLSHRLGGNGNSPKKGPSDSRRVLGWLCVALQYSQHKLLLLCVTSAHFSTVCTYYPFKSCGSDSDR